MNSQRIFFVDFATYCTIYFGLKLKFSEKATKIDKIFSVNLIVCSNCQIDGEDFVNFCGLLRKHELYQPDAVWAKHSAQGLFVWEILAYLWPCSKFTLFLFTRDSTCCRRALSLWSFHSLLLRTFTYHFTRRIYSHVKPVYFFQIWIC